MCAANEDLKNTISALLNDCSKTTPNQTGNQSFVLNSLVKAAQRNNLKNVRKNGFRYENQIKDFSLYIFMLGGRLLYETL